MNTAPTHDEVHDALMWALDHNHRALADHRMAHHTASSDAARLAADEDLVSLWPGHQLVSA